MNARLASSRSGCPILQYALFRKWAGVKNGALLNRAETQFEVFITTDKNLRYQQNLANRKLAFILLPTNQVPVVAALIPEIETALNNIQIGDFVEIPYP